MTGPTNAIEHIVQGFLDFSGNPIVSMAFSTLGAEVRKRRLEEARRILMARMRKGATWAFREDDLASTVFDFLRAAENGAAHENLRLLAQMVSRGAADAGLTSESLRHLMALVAELSYDELVVLAAFIRVTRRQRTEETRHPHGPTAQLAETWAKVQQELAHTHLDAIGSYYAYAAALQRTGLVIPYSGFGGITFGPANALLQLEQLLDLDDPELSPEVRGAQANTAEGLGHPNP